MKKKYPIYVLGVLLLCVVPFAYVLFQAETKDIYIPQSTYTEVVALDFEKNYPKNPHSLISENNKIIRSLYSGAVLQEEIEPALVKQRKLFSDEIIEKNTLEYQLSNTIREISLLAENTQYIISIDIESVLYDEDDNKICTVITKQNTTTGHLIYTEYRLAVINGDWKILGWTNTIIQGQEEE